MTPHEMNIVVLSRYLRSELALAGFHDADLQQKLANIESDIKAGDADAA